MAVDVSLIIVSWNGRKHLLDCLDSIDKTEPTSDREVIVIDNASTDGSAEAVAGQYPHHRLIVNRSNLGFSKANNLGIREAHGRYICLVNSDVLLPKCTFAPLIEYMDAHPDVGMVGPRVLNPDGTLQASCYRRTNPVRELIIALGLDRVLDGTPLSTRYPMDRWQKDAPREVDMITGCFNLVRREAIDDAGMMDESLFFYGDDMDWCKRFIEHGWKVVYNPVIEIVHFGGGSSSSSPVKFFIEYQKARVQYWSIHYGPVGRAFCSAMILLHHALRLLGRLCIHPFLGKGRASNAMKLKLSVVGIRWLLGLDPVDQPRIPDSKST